MARSIIVLETGKVRADIRRVKAKVREGANIALEETKLTMTRYAEFLIGQAQAKINNRSNDLSRSGTVTELIESEGELRVEFGFNSPHGAQTDTGGRIRPKKARNLAIPLPPVLTPSGIARFNSPREESDLFVLVGKRHIFLAKKSKGRKLVRSDLHWLLVPSVTQKGTRYFANTIKENQERTSTVIAEAVKKRLET